MADDDTATLVAVIQNDVQHIRRDIGEIRSELKYLSTQIVQISNDLLGRITELEKHEAATKERWVAHGKDHERETRALRAYSTILSTVESAIVAVIGMIPKGP